MTQARSHLLPPEKFPLTITLFSGKTGEVVWSKTITLAEAKHLARIDIPGFANTEHYPVRAEVHCADGTVDIEGLQ